MRPGDGAVRVAAVHVDASADRAARTAAGRDALRALAAELVGADAADVTVRARCATCGGQHGRPVLGGSRALDALHASVAHAGDAVVVAVSGHGPIGIDAEQRGREAPPGTTLAQWVRIEAVLKADGRGLRVDPALVRFEADPTGMTARIDGEEARYRVRDLELGAVGVVALAQHDAGDPERPAPTAVRRPGV
ncbi:4-phosphopantetheinyl transferase [Clavibacter michiganensis]|uniref:4-phosphopantetheinyl transferase n=1 Tax=Clavibacter michiganensis TaxID=28447 RepID=A0A2S5VWI9_9MICO|nr:4-phosphopantetheinyl transferase [Clavibacter michiganensis]PPF69975.1 4-phosphopantetheinyl transferase [Clavibacter michiganensis]